MKHPADEIVHGEPIIRSCLMHPIEPMYQTFKIESPDPNWSGITYGLCEYCFNLLDAIPSYENLINREIEERFIKLKKERENVR